MQGLKRRDNVARPPRRSADALPKRKTFGEKEGFAWGAASSPRTFLLIAAMEGNGGCSSARMQREKSRSSLKKELLKMGGSQKEMR